MATNHYFNNLRAVNEQSVIEDLVVESIKIHGMDVFYLPRTLVNKDTLLGEDGLSRFSTTKPIEMYLETVNGFEGDQDLLSKFGLQVKDSATLIVSKKRFQKESGMTRPMEGDIIYLPMTRGLFEIKFVEHESPFYQLGKNYVFKLRVELFQFSEETFSTGEPEIDSIADNNMYNIFLGLGAGTTSLAFTVDGSVYQYTNGTVTGGSTGADATATVVGHSGSTLILKNVVGDWQETSDGITRYVTSEDGTVYRTVTSLSDTVDLITYDDNKDIETQSDTLLDFTITNPFGEA